MTMLTLLAGGRSAQPLAVSARGVAQFMESGRYAARKLVEAYVFPKEERPKKMMPVPARNIVLAYFRRGQRQEILDQAIAQYSDSPPGEKAFAKGRRKAALIVARHLKSLGPKFPFRNVHSRPMHMTIRGVKVRSSLDFICKDDKERVLGVIVNVSNEVSKDKSKLEHYALIECEIAWRITRETLPLVEQILFIDALTESLVRRHVKEHKTAWRDIEAACRDMVMTYNDIVSAAQRRQREQA